MKSIGGGSQKWTIAFEKILFVLGAGEHLGRLEGKIRKYLFFYAKIFEYVFVSNNNMYWKKISDLKTSLVYGF